MRIRLQTIHVLKTFAVVTAALPLFLLFSPTVESQGIKEVEKAASTADHIAFDFRDTSLKMDSAPVVAQVIATFETDGGKITFIDEGTSVSTVLIGSKAVFKLAENSDSLAALYRAVAPRGESVPNAILVSDATREREGRELVFGGGTTAGPTISEDFEEGDDDWANGCASDSINEWTEGFEEWSDDGNFIINPNDFSHSAMYDLGKGTVGDLNGYFGTLDSIWYGACFVDGVVSSIQMEYRNFSICFASPTGWQCGIWSPIAGTQAILSPGERYLYHNHSTYSPLRRGSISSIGNANITGWKYFVSGAATDNFAADDWFQAP